MTHIPTAADRLGASWNLCCAYEASLQATSALLAADLEGAPAAEKAELRAERDKRHADLAGFHAQVSRAFAPKNPSTLTQYAANDQQPRQVS